MPFNNQVRKLSFVRRHDRALTVIGAAIVFATFIVKEDLRESWKNTADAIETAQVAFDVRADIYKTLSAQAEASQNLSRLLDHGEPLAPLSEAMREKTFISRVYYDDLVGHMTAQLDIAAVLLDRLPKKDDLRRQGEALESSLLHFKTALDAVEDDADAQRGNSLFVDDNFPIDEADDLQPKVDAFVDAVLKDAKDLRNENKRKAGIASWLTTTLFVMGWLLGLTGKLYGTPIDEES